MISPPNLVIMSPSFRPALDAALPGKTSVTSTPSMLVEDEADDLKRIVALSANVTKSLSYERDGKEITVSVLIRETSEPTIIRGQSATPESNQSKTPGSRYVRTTGATWLSPW